MHIPTHERLIFALDYPSAVDAKAMVAELGGSVHFYKLGLELFTTAGSLELLAWLHDCGKKTFVDLKFFDVPETVHQAVAQVARSGAYFTTVHGNDAIIESALSAKGEHLKILAVTLLTSLDQADIEALGFQASLTDVVVSRAERAAALGCDGVVASGQEAALIRERTGDVLTIVTPGIRNTTTVDDQKRTVTVEDAFAGGTDYVVVGRPIKHHRGFASPKAAALAMQAQIANCMTARQQLADTTARKNNQQTVQLTERNIPDADCKTVQELADATPCTRKQQSAQTA